MNDSINPNQIMETNASLALTVMDCEGFNGVMEDVCMLAIIRNQVKDLVSHKSLMEDEFLFDVAQMMRTQN